MPASERVPEVVAALPAEATPVTDDDAEQPAHEFNDWEML